MQWPASHPTKTWRVSNSQPNGALVETFLPPHDLPSVLHPAQQRECTANIRQAWQIAVSTTSLPRLRFLPLSPRVVQKSSQAERGDVNEGTEALIDESETGQTTSPLPPAVIAALERLKKTGRVRTDAEEIEAKLQVRMAAVFGRKMQAY